MKCDVPIFGGRVLSKNPLRAPFFLSYSRAFLQIEMISVPPLNILKYLNVLEQRISAV